MSAIVYYLNFLSGGPIVERGELAQVIPLRGSPETLVRMAAARRLEAIEHNLAGDVDGFWSRIDDAKAFEGEAARIRAARDRCASALGLETE